MQRPGHSVLGVTVSLVARSTQESLLPDNIRELVKLIVADAGIAKPETDLHAATNGSPLWLVAQQADDDQAYDVLRSRITALKNTPSTIS